MRDIDVSRILSKHFTESGDLMGASWSNMKKIVDATREIIDYVEKHPQKERGGRIEALERSDIIKDFQYIISFDDKFGPFGLYKHITTDFTIVKRGDKVETISEGGYWTYDLDFDFNKLKGVFERKKEKE